MDFPLSLGGEIPPNPVVPDAAVRVGLELRRIRIAQTSFELPRTSLAQEFALVTAEQVREALEPFRHMIDGAPTPVWVGLNGVVLRPVEPLN